VQKPDDASASEALVEPPARARPWIHRMRLLILSFGLSQHNVNHAASGMADALTSKSVTSGRSMPTRQTRGLTELHARLFPEPLPPPPLPPPTSSPPHPERRLIVIVNPDPPKSYVPTPTPLNLQRRQKYRRSMGVSDTRATSFNGNNECPILFAVL